MNTIIPKLSVTALMLALTLFTHNAESGILIDNFSDSQIATNGGDGPLGIIGTDLTNVQRILTATASSSTATTEVTVETGLLTIFNSIASNGTASIKYSFNTIDLTAFADDLLLTAVSIDSPGNEVQIIANGSSIFSLPNFGGSGQHSISFSQFSNASVFTHWNLYFKALIPGMPNLAC